MKMEVKIINGRRKVFIHNKISGEDKRKEASNIILGRR